MSRKGRFTSGQRVVTNHPRRRAAGEAQRRTATTKRADGTRSCKQRCPRCKKLRVKWFRANAWYPARRKWQRRAEGLVCPLCIARETDPTVVGVRMGQLQHRKEVDHGPRS